MTPAVMPTESVCSIKASLVLDGRHYAVPGSGYPLTLLGAHGKDEAFLDRHKMWGFAHTYAWNLGAFALDIKQR
jgi:hypothetical protein